MSMPSVTPSQTLHPVLVFHSSSPPPPRIVLSIRQYHDHTALIQTISKMHSRAHISAQPVRIRLSFTPPKNLHLVRIFHASSTHPLTLSLTHQDHNHVVLSWTVFEDALLVALESAHPTSRRLSKHFPVATLQFTPLRTLHPPLNFHACLLHPGQRYAPLTMYISLL
jgi:hypothetical protein